MSLFTSRHARLQFERLESEKDVSDALAASLLGLQQLRDDGVKGLHYRPLLLRKKGRHHSGQYRTVYVVSRDLRRLQLEIQESLRLHFTPPDTVFGFVRGRSTLEHAKVHHPARVLLNLDIKNFFDSIREAQVATALRSLGTGEPASRLLAALCCFHGALPQGASTSPSLSNLVCQTMDVQLLALAQRAGAKYTRYVDDLSFSGENVPNVTHVSNVLAAYGFTLNQEKTSWRRLGQPQFVTGLSLASPLGVRLTQRTRRYLRLRLYYAHKARFRGEEIGGALDSKLSGLLAYCFSIEPDLTKHLLRSFPLGAPADWTPYPGDNA
jgi:RNA-directed DNA polymerase